MHKSKIKLTIFILLVLFSNNVLSEAYFDISEDNIKIETNKDVGRDEFKFIKSKTGEDITNEMTLDKDISMA